MRGRKPKPLRIQIAEGDTRKRGVNKLKELAESEPKAERGLPPCPVHLMGRARRLALLERRVGTDEARP